MDAIVLAGGLGTRLRSVVTNLPKPMAPIQNKPFLFYLLKKLSGEGFKRVVLSTGYKHEVIEEFFGQQFADMEIIYCREDTPLGTGGAIVKSLKLCSSDPCFVFNGDTYLDFSAQDLMQTFAAKQADVLIPIKTVHEGGRYGSVDTNDTGRIIAFGEKTKTGEADVNCGVYVLRRDLFDKVTTPAVPFSFEAEILAKNLTHLRIIAATTDAYFIDIGIPEDLKKAEVEIPALISTYRAPA